MYFALFPLFGVYSWGHSKCKAQRITRNTSRSCPTLCLGYQLQHSPILSGGGPDRTLQAVRVVPHPPLLPPPHKAGHWPGGGGSSGGCGTSRVAWSVWSGFPSPKNHLSEGVSDTSPCYPRRAPHLHQLRPRGKRKQYRKEK